MLQSSGGKGFKPAPTKLAKELAENAADEPEPPYLRQFILGDRAIKNRRLGELLRSYGTGAGAVTLAVALPILFAPLWLSVTLVVLATLAAGALIGTSMWFSWDAKVADLESRALVTEGDKKIKVLDLGPVEEQMEKSA
jgi:hypothetical protein